MKDSRSWFELVAFLLVNPFGWIGLYVLCGCIAMPIHGVP